MKRVVVVSLFSNETDRGVSLRFPVQPGHAATVPAVVAAALCAEKPPVITIEVDEVAS